MVAYYAPGYGICLGVITVSIDTGFDKFNLRDSQERPAALEDLVREVDDKGVCQQSNSDSNNTLLRYLLAQRSMKNTHRCLRTYNYKDPPPPSYSLNSVHLHKPVGKY